MITDPQSYVPAEIEMRTAFARGAFRAQPRRARTGRRRRFARFLHRPTAA